MAVCSSDGDDEEGGEVSASASGSGEEEAVEGGSDGDAARAAAALEAAARWAKPPRLSEPPMPEPRRSTRISAPASMGSVATSHSRWRTRSSMLARSVGHSSSRALGREPCAAYTAGASSRSKQPPALEAYGRFWWWPSMKVCVPGTSTVPSERLRSSCTGNRGPANSPTACPGRSGTRAKRPRPSTAPTPAEEGATNDHSLSGP